ncbi:Smr protein/MutS2 [Ketogulonicigenium robustum]|uniref:Smr protein/MutS2 n=1 Tax=Ketogulonicigenium robustum TaxID=92947 RepID=A0A1W6P2N7_9RHOB|nr:Smr protein/MutS2 [Ketogulonicigenium robustum]
MKRSKSGFVPLATPTPPPALVERPAPVLPTAPLAPFKLGQKAGTTRKAHDLAPPVHEAVKQAPLKMDSKTHGRMVRGKLKPEGRIDLHGMTLDEAHPALLSFIAHSHMMGRRLVLVITGKGKLRDDMAPMPARVGILRHAVPQWLNMMPLRAMILDIRPAHISHGGIGAYYVYLSRRR